MNEISLVKRVKYAGDIHTELLKSEWDLDTATTFVNNIPDADVAPVRHGRWIYHRDSLYPNDSTQECSYCHAEEYLTLHNENYCPNCGAKMYEEVSE